MGLRDRFRDNGRPAEPSENEHPRGRGNGNGNSDSATATERPSARALTDRSTGLKARIHRRMVERINLASLESVDPERLRTQIRQIISALLAEENIPMTEAQRAALEQEVLNETFGLGPIEPFLHDPDVADILVNTHRQVYIERFGKLELTGTKFDNDEHVMRIIDRIVSRVGRRVDESSPMVDARLPDGSRVNAIIPPLSIDGPVLSIRRFGVRTLHMNDLLELHTVSPGMAEVLQGVIRGRLNTLISGGTGSGKTTLLNAMSAFIPAEERIVTIEDAAELQLLQPHVVRLETRPTNIEGRGEITQRDLVKNALRMRPDRIVVGEVRGSEVMDMLQAMNTGHDGSLTTVHANSQRDALHRLETLMLMSGVNLPNRVMREQISAALDVIVQVTRFSDGTRRVIAVSEIVGMEQDVVAMQDIFVFRKTGLDEEGRVLGQFEATGIRPKFADRLKLAGVDVSPAVFREGQVL
ncbi:MAG TPA: CpaF family protein [Candidatus Krumholzibacteria bacterium]|nr:CpaF family protein [Candidatus Krumholzibacteria bacterium]